MGGSPKPFLGNSPGGTAHTARAARTAHTPDPTCTAHSFCIDTIDWHKPVNWSLIL